MGHEPIHPESLAVMRQTIRPGDRWAAYENRDLGHPECGHLQFLAIGPTRSYQHPPERLPDMRRQINWRYVLVGWVNLDTATIEELEPARGSRA
jgi:hypothetical protein